MENRDNEAALRNTEDGEECPLCQCGTVEHNAGFVSCTGECGASVEQARILTGIAPGSLSMIVASRPKTMKLVRELVAGDDVRSPSGKWSTVRSVVVVCSPIGYGGWVSVKYANDNRQFNYCYDAKREVS